MVPSRFGGSIFAVAVMFLGASVVFGQDYPSKPIRIYTGSSGGSNDAASRLIASGITGPLGQPIVIENRGSSAVSAITVAAAAPDGYSLLLGGDLIWLNPLLTGQPDALTVFAPISMLASAPNIVAVHPSLPVKSVKELIALAKARPGELNYASTATGGIDHIIPELFKSMTGTRIIRVAYKGSGNATRGLAGGEVHMYFGGVEVTAPFVKAGKIKALAVTSEQPSKLAVGLPTLSESGLPGFDLVGTDALYTTIGTPAPIINRLSQEIVRFLNTKDAQEKYFALGAEVMASTPEQHVKILKSRINVIGKLIKDAGITAK